VVKRPLRISTRTCHVVTVAVDISLRRRMEQMKTEFISTVSHELRTPLTAIRGALGMLIGGIAGHIGDDARPLLDIAHKNSERLVRLINDILDIEKLEAGRLAFNFGHHDVRALVQQALSDIQPYARDYDVNLTLVGADESLSSEAMVDPDRFAQVMANLRFLRRPPARRHRAGPGNHPLAGAADARTDRFRLPGRSRLALLAAAAAGGATSDAAAATHYAAGQSSPA